MQKKYFFVSYLKKKKKKASQFILPGAFFQYVIWKIWQTCPKKFSKISQVYNEKETFLQKNSNSFVQK